MSIDHIVGTGRAFAALNGDGSIVTSYEAATGRQLATVEDCAQAFAGDIVYGTSVTSNPSPSYIRSVVEAFRSGAYNGKNVFWQLW